ncbi:MAG: hypothetical protein ACR2P6_10320 [Gammaproteobacteria bacterium]
MKKDEVPQDSSAAYAGQKKAVYATDTEGRYGLTRTTGWEAEEHVLEQALEHLKGLANEAMLAVQEGRASPLLYHMYARRMDFALLAQSTGFFRWQVKRHCRPAVFARLPAASLQRYAEALGLAVAELQRCPEPD